MASQVLSGTTGIQNKPSISYTNNTGQNVRIIINFASLTVNPDISGIYIIGFSVSCGGMNYGPAPLTTFGKHLTGAVLQAYYPYSPSEYAIQGYGQNALRGYMPTELMLPPNGTFDLSGDFELNSGNSNPLNPANGRLSYNIVVIPEAG